MRCVLLSHLVCVCCAGACGNLWQHWCSGCNRQQGADNRHTRCTACRNKQKVESEEQKSSDPLAQIGENASQLMASLPTHSHHRAPLLHALSHHVPSSTAAALLHAAPSTVRNAKRKDYRDSDLLQQRYASGVKRQRLAPQRTEQLCDFVAATCPTKSGERSVSYHQYTTDASLYSAYRTSAAAPVSFNTFRRVKQWMRVRRAGRYLGHFDCSKCVTYNISCDGADRRRGTGDAPLPAASHHKKLQRQQYQQMRSHLQPRQLLVLMDFTSAFLTVVYASALRMHVRQRRLSPCLSQRMQRPACASVQSFRTTTTVCISLPHESTRQVMSTNAYGDDKGATGGGGAAGSLQSAQQAPRLRSTAGSYAAWKPDMDVYLERIGADGVHKRAMTHDSWRRLALQVQSWSDEALALALAAIGVQDSIPSAAVSEADASNSSSSSSQVDSASVSSEQKEQRRLVTCLLYT